MSADNKVIKGYFVWSIPFLLLVACHNNSTTVAAKADPRNVEWYAVHDEKNAKQNNSNKLDVYILRFYPDSSYTLCADLLFEQGNWKFEEGKKLFLLTPSTKASEVAERFIDKQLLAKDAIAFRFYHQYPINTQNPDEVMTVQAVTNQSAYDPYGKTVNQWRTKPGAIETSAQIKQRVIAYLTFLQALYHHAKDNKIENAGGTWYPQPIRFYSNKVSMAYADELNDWYNCFYNDAQAVEAYQLISGALMKTTIKGNDDVSRNINCVEQLLTEIKK